MKKKGINFKVLAVTLTLFLAVPPGVFAQEPATGDPATAAPTFKQEDLDRLLAPIALYPDSLVSQILMASTYPLEVIHAARWAKENEGLSGDAMAQALEAQPWDPSVKSLVNFPQVLEMMNSRLDETQSLGDAFLAQQKDVLDTIQSLRQKAQAQGNLNTTAEQTVIVEKETQTIIIEAADPQVVYVPVYNPTVVYGTWWWPHYPPPYYYYPPGYAYSSAAFSFAAGVAVGAAWGYAWGNCNWHGGDVNINVNQNANINKNIDRGKYATQYNKTGQAGKGSWQHDASHRKGVAYQDKATAQKYNKASTTQAAKSREAYRGYADKGRQDLARGSADQFKGRQPSTMNRGGASGQRPSAGTSNMTSRGSSQSQRPSAGTGNMKSSSPSQRSSASTGNRKSSGSHGSSAFSGMSSGSSTRQASSRGKSSRSSMSQSGSGSSRSSAGSRSGGGVRSGGGRR